MRKPEDCSDMSHIRAEIDRLDQLLVEALTERSRYIDRAAQIKSTIAWPARIDARVEEVVANVRRAAEARGLDSALVEDLWRHLIDWSIAREEKHLGQAASPPSAKL